MITGQWRCFIQHGSRAIANQIALPIQNLCAIVFFYLIKRAGSSSKDQGLLILSSHFPPLKLVGSK